MNAKTPLVAPPKANQGTSLDQNTYGTPPAYQPVLTLHRQHPSVLRRFFGAFFVALAILVTVHFATHHRKYYMGPYEEAGWPMPADGDIERCISSGNWEADHSRDVFGKFPYSEKTSFSLPVSAENLYFLSHGQNSHGDLAILTSDQDDDAVRVEVVVRYYTKGALERATVCQLKRGHDEHGFGIFTPREWHSRYPRDQLRFEVAIYLPTSSSRSNKLQIKSLETSMHNFAHTIAGLKDLVSFNKLSLSTSNAVVKADYIEVLNGAIHTTNGPIAGNFNTIDTLTLKSSNGLISGHFNVSKTLILETSNNPIEVEVGLKNEDESHPSFVKMRTTNGRILSAVHLLRSHASGGAYAIEAHTSNNPLNLIVPSSPYSSFLRLDAHTTNSPSKITLHPAYEGSYSIRSSMIAPKVEYSGDVEDPSGQGRHRVHNTHRVTRGHLVEGSVRWGEEGGEKGGSVTLSTSNSPAVLEL